MPEDFTLTAEDLPLEEEPPNASEEWRFEGDPRITPMAPVEEVQRGGFLRRAGAFVLDIIIVLLLASIMGILAFIGYKVGLAAHHRTVAIDNAAPLAVFLTFGWFLLTTAYFVLFHGMDGRTIGKWLLGLRVVGPERTPITYRQAFLRWLGLVVAIAPFAAGILWILLNREKRGWHDYIARTWVVRDSGISSKQ